jgi:hypothetical protein
MADTTITLVFNKDGDGRSIARQPSRIFAGQTYTQEQGVKETMRNSLLIRSLWAWGFIGAVVFSPTKASADAVTTYNNRATWNAAASGVQTIDFGSLNPPNGGFNTYPSPAGLTVDGVNFTGSPSSVTVVSDTFCCATYGRGFDTLDTGVASTITATLPSGVNAVGFDLFGVQNGDAAGALTETVDITVDGTTYKVTTPTLSSSPNLAFFGVVDPSDPISTFTITPEQNPAGVAADIVNFSFGSTTSAPPVPEPSSFLLAGSGLFLLSIVTVASRR